MFGGRVTVRQAAGLSNIFKKGGGKKSIFFCLHLGLNVVFFKTKQMVAKATVNSKSRGKA
jgi:hypothetical protein